jgi:hypothetical protein
VERDQWRSRPEPAHVKHRPLGGIDRNLCCEHPVDDACDHGDHDENNEFLHTGILAESPFSFWGDGRAPPGAMQGGTRACEHEVEAARMRASAVPGSRSRRPPSLKDSLVPLNLNPRSRWNRSVVVRAFTGVPGAIGLYVLCAPRTELSGESFSVARVGPVDPPRGLKLKGGPKRTGIKPLPYRARGPFQGEDRRI